MSKKVTILCLLLSAGISCFAAGNNADPLRHPALNPVKSLTVEKHAPLRLVENGELRFAIAGKFAEESKVRGPENQSLAKFGRLSRMQAAKALAAAFQTATGKKPEILELDSSITAKYPCLIVVGKNEITDKLGMKPYELPREGFEVRTFEKGIAIAGCDAFMIPGHYDLYNWRCGRITCNGTENGAYDFVERFLGFRFYCPADKNGGGVHAPALKDLTIQPAAYSDYPRYQMRGSRNPEARTGTSTDFFGGEAPSPFALAKAHPDQLETIFYRDPHGKLWQHPKAYGENFFDVSNPVLAEILVSDFKQYYKDQGKDSYWGQTWAPSSRYLWFGQCDKGMFLDTPDARKFPRKNPLGYDSMSEVYGEFYRILGSRIETEFPGRTLVLMAYANYLGAPRLLEKLPDNTQILACVGTPVFIRSRRHTDFCREIYSGWNRLTKKKVVPYTYDGGYSEDDVIVQSLRGFFEGEFLREMAPYIDPNLCYPCVWNGGARYYYSTYLLHRALWNPDFNARAALDEYWELMYGKKAAVHLKKFYDILVDRWSNHYLPAADPGKGSIAGPDYKILYTKTFPEKIVKELIIELENAEKAIAPDSPAKERFEFFAAPFKKVLPDIIAYQNISYPPIILKKASSPIKIDGIPEDEAWKAAAPVVLKPAFAGGDRKVIQPDLRVLWDEKGFYLAFSSPAPCKAGKSLWDGDTVELFLSPGKSKTMIYQFVIGSSGNYEDYQKQVDPPRGLDSHWNAPNAKYVSCTSSKGWSAELFVPWNDMDIHSVPLPGDVWFGNIISNRFMPLECTSVSPTLNNNRRIEMYSKIIFTGEKAER